MKSLIAGVGSYLPAKIITNDDLSQTLDTSHEWITTRTGISKRHVADYKNGETCVYMGSIAAKRALEMAQMDAGEIDLILTATVTSDYHMPSAACMIQQEIGAEKIPAFDISAACAGSIYALNIADSFIRSGQYKNILVITSEVLSSVVNWQDRNTAVLFGDGASAAVLTASDKNFGFIDFMLKADGNQKETIFIPAGGSKQPLNEELLNNQANKIKMNGKETFKFAVRSMCEITESILSKNNLSAKDISYVVPHQANLRIIEAIAKRIDLPMEKFLVNLDKYANTSAASLLLAYDEAVKNKKFNNNDMVLMLAIGAGFAWGAGLYRFKDPL